MGLRFKGHLFPCSIGRSRLSLSKREGDGATPVGIWHIVSMYYRPDRLAPPQAWAQPIRLGDLWCDAPDSADYNQPVRTPFAESHEVLRRADPLYDIVLVTDYNYPLAKPGLGSAIFLHQQRRPGFPTEGCIALRRDHLIWLAQNLAFGTQLIIPPLSGQLLDP